MKFDTLAVTAGRHHPEQFGGSVSAPVDRAATRIFPDLPSIEAAHATGRLSAFLGSATPDHAAEAIAELEGGTGKSVVTSSGMSALTLTFLAALNHGEHLLMPDSVFGPTRSVANDLLARMGIESSYYHPLADEAALRAAMRPNTRLVLTESPGSNTFEVQDIPMIVRLAHEHGALVANDNSWATPFFFRPLDHGVDFSICAATKYLVGHSDAIVGTVTTPEHLFGRLQAVVRQVGDACSADNAWLLARGLRTLPVRMRQHDASTRRIVNHLLQQPGVRNVLHPALENAPGHACWKRDFSGASGLFGLLLDPLSRPELEGFLQTLKFFHLGYSWGGFESLVLPIEPDPARTFLAPQEGTLLRVHIGLEDADDLLADLDAAFAVLQKQ